MYVKLVGVEVNRINICGITGEAKRGRKGVILTWKDDESAEFPDSNYMYFQARRIDMEWGGWEKRYTGSIILGEVRS